MAVQRDWFEKDYYAKEGIEPKEYSFTSSTDIVSTMANGDADFLPGVEDFAIPRFGFRHLSDPVPSYVCLHCISHPTKHPHEDHAEEACDQRDCNPFDE